MKELPPHLCCTLKSTWFQSLNRQHSVFRDRKSAFPEKALNTKLHSWLQLMCGYRKEFLSKWKNIWIFQYYPTQTKSKHSTYFGGNYCRFGFFFNAGSNSSVFFQLIYLSHYLLAWSRMFFTISQHFWPSFNFPTGRPLDTTELDRLLFRLLLL